jgi:hypothetical protein
MALICIFLARNGTSTQDLLCLSLLLLLAFCFCKLTPAMRKRFDVNPTVALQLVLAVLDITRPLGSSTERDTLAAKQV